MLLAQRVDPAAVKDCHAVGHAEHLVPAVADQNGSAAEVPEQGQHLPLHLVPQVGVQGGERLIQHQDPGLSHQDPGKGGPLLLSPGQFVGIAVLQPPQLIAGESLPGNLPFFRP